MATFSFKEFSAGNPVTPVGNESDLNHKKSYFEATKRVENTDADGSLGDALQTFGSGIKEAFNKRVDTASDELSSAMQGKTSPFRATLRAFGQGAGAVGDIALEGAKLAAPKFVEDTAKKGLEKIGETETAQNLAGKYAELKTKHPEAMKDIEAVLNLGSLLPIEKAVGLGAKGVESGVKAATRGTVNAADAVADEAKAVAQNVKTTLAKNAVDPRLKESAERLLPMVGKEKKINPSQRYDEFYQQEQKFKSDIKQDTALSLVGEKIGNSFENVVKQRRDVGKVMETELKKFGDIQTDVTDSFSNFEKKLFEENRLAYDADSGKLVSTAKQSAMTADDKGLLEKYIADLNELGANPTIADLDAFMKRVPSELDVYKSSKNITGTTNGERIIKNHLKELREQFNPEKTGNTALTDYYEARKAYSGLSDFIEEGESFLGKKTQSGDFAKDASMAKSSVQSVLNNGKKDWLIKLEELTGYPALDESVLALQAMKDAGNFRGLSLLETLSDGPLPTSKAGITQKLLDYGITKGTEAFLGSPDKQTRQFLKSLETGGTNSE